MAGPGTSPSNAHMREAHRIFFRNAHRSLSGTEFPSQVGGRRETLPFLHGIFSLPSPSCRGCPGQQRLGCYSSCSFSASIFSRVATNLTMSNAFFSSSLFFCASTISMSWRRFCILTLSRCCCVSRPLIMFLYFLGTPFVSLLQLTLFKVFCFN